MKPFVYLITNSLAVYVASYVLPGVHVRDFFVAVVVAVILGAAPCLGVASAARRMF